LTFGAGAEHWKMVVTDCCPELSVAASPSKRDLPANLRDVSCLIGFRFADELFDLLPNLRLIQNLSVGVESLVENPRISPHVRITNTARLYGDAIAEYVIWAMLTLFRQFHTVMRNQGKRTWKQVSGSGLAGKTVGILGLGDVGRHVARQAAALGMQTTGFVRDEKSSLPHDDVDAVCSINQLMDNIGTIDALVLCLPLTDSTIGLINSNIIEGMKEEAIVINVSRAGLIDGSAVTDAVASGSIAGAALDVFEREPLRKWTPLWKYPNLLITPHIASLRSDYKTRVADLVRQNMVRFAEDRPLLNEIDRSRGY